MRQVLASITLLVVAAVAWAVDPIPQQEALRIAELLTQSSDKVDDFQLKFEVDREKPYGIRQGEFGCMIIPVKGLSEDTIAKAGKEPTPVGHLWFRKMAPAVDGKVLPTNQLRIVQVTANGQDLHLPLFLVGVQKGTAGPELVLFGKEKAPLAKLPLKQAEGQQEQPVEMDGEKKGEDAGLITLKVLGKYRAELTVMEQQ